MKRVFLLMAVAAVSACDSGPLATTICERDRRPGIAVKVVDAEGTTPAPFADLQVIARSGTYADTATDIFRPTPDTTLALLAWERPGTYAVDVHAPGYVTWTTEGIRVPMTKDGCHVVSQNVVARLRR